MDKYDVLISWNVEDSCFTALIPGNHRFRAFGETRAEALKHLGIVTATNPEYIEDAPYKTKNRGQITSRHP